jgi:hypothetical protein
MMDNCSSKPDESLRIVVHNLRDLEKNLVLYLRVNFRAIQDKVKHEKLLEYSLEVNDDINKTFSRYDNLKMGKKGTFTPSDTTLSYMKGKDVPSGFREQPRQEFKETSSKSINKPQSNPVLIDMFDTTTVKDTSTQPKNDLFDIFSQVPITTTSNTINTNVTQTNFVEMNSGHSSPMNKNTISVKKEINLTDLLSQAYSNNIQSNVNMVYPNLT